jgi:D-alanine-D-alanine ligase
MKKIRMLVLAGGRSAEHEVSLISTRSLLKALQDSPIEATTVVITREGRWLSAAESEKALTDGKAIKGGEMVLHRAQVAEHYDVVFPLIHGPYGEDGTVQGMLELAGVPYIGSGVLSSALCMDKPMAKDVLRSHGLPQVNYIVFTRHEFAQNPEEVLHRCQQMSSPWFVKPANLGSSIGISKATTVKELHASIDMAKIHDRRIIVEEAAVGCRELEVAILGNDEPKASPIGEITYQSAFYDYETKYTEGRAQLMIPAEVPQDVVARIHALGLKAYRLLDCAGFARADFFYLPQKDQVLVNEVNTIPGFTPFSMFTRLWEAGGIPYANLVERLAELAIERHRERR